jgi:Uma2 family endonuclease
MTTFSQLDLSQSDSSQPDRPQGNLLQMDLSQLDPDILYPSGDGKPMAESTEQYRWIVMIKENLELLFANDPTVFIAADLFWYPLQSTIVPPVAPDVMVAFGRPKGKRRSYRQWEEANIPPQIVFEILSHANTPAEMRRKRDFYETYRVEEYYIYDPDTFELQGWQRSGNALVQLESLDHWVSPRSGIQFMPQQGELEIYRPDGRRFLTSLELEQRAEAQQQRAEAQQQRAEAQQQRAEQAEAQLRQVALNLLQTGMSLEQVANLTGLSLAQLEQLK